AARHRSSGWPIVRDRRDRPDRPACSIERESQPGGLHPQDRCYEQVRGAFPRLLWPCQNGPTRIARWSRTQVVEVRNIPPVAASRKGLSLFYPQNGRIPCPALQFLRASEGVL